MKYLFIFIALAVTAAGYYFDQQAPRPHSNYVLLVDITRDYIDVPLKESIVSDLGLIETPEKGVTLRIALVSDMLIDEVEEYNLESAPPLTISEGQRSQQIRDFVEEVDRRLQEIRNTAPGLPNSSIYIPVNESILWLNEQQGSKHLFVYSDLEEHGRVSVYTNANIDLHKTEPEYLVPRLTDLAPAAESSELSIIIRGRPESRERSMALTNLVSTYRQIYPKAIVNINVSR